MLRILSRCDRSLNTIMLVCIASIESTFKTMLVINHGPPRSVDSIYDATMKRLAY